MKRLVRCDWRGLAQRRTARGKVVRFGRVRDWVVLVEVGVAGAGAKGTSARLARIGLVRRSVTAAARMADSAGMASSLLKRSSTRVIARIAAVWARWWIMRARSDAACS
ncbi:MAG: hypothetical protein U0570_14770 [Phycisphaerales bacterium]